MYVCLYVSMNISMHGCVYIFQYVCMYVDIMDIMNLGIIWKWFMGTPWLSCKGTSHGYYVCMWTWNGHEAMGHHFIQYAVNTSIHIQYSIPLLYKMLYADGNNRNSIIIPSHLEQQWIHTTCSYHAFMQASTTLFHASMNCPACSFCHLQTCMQ